MILTVALYPAGPSGAYSPDGGGMGYMMDGGAAAAAAMMHRPPADPMAFHSEYHYPPQYYGHHLWRKETTARNDNISITRLSLLHSPSTSFFFGFCFVLFPVSFLFCKRRMFSFSNVRRPLSSFHNSRTRGRKRKKNTPQSYIYTYMYHNVITIKHHVYYYATLPTFPPNKNHITNNSSGTRLVTRLPSDPAQSTSFPVDR